MGLDQRAYSREVPTSDAFSWRKHSALQGWMQDLYYAKGGTADSFNCIPLRLEFEDIERLEVAINEGTLEERDGFFWSGGTAEEWKEYDLEFIAWAKEELSNGMEVYYDCWW